MEQYIFQGVVLPERAQLTLRFHEGFYHLVSGVEGVAKVSILLNQVVVWVESDYVWDIYDLRNLVKSIVQNYLAMVGYLTGYAYDFEVTRVLNQSREIDLVFGIDTECIVKRCETINLQDALVNLRNKTIGANGVFLNRCFTDFVFSMKHADDTGFYCYRAIESLRHHCAAVHKLSGAKNSEQWKKFREVSGCAEKTIRAIEDAARPLRHGEASGSNGEDRAKLLTSTWDVINMYLNCV